MSAESLSDHIHRIVRPRHPLHDGLVKSWRQPSSKTGRNQHRAVGVLRRIHDITAMVLQKRHVVMASITEKHNVILKTGSTSRGSGSRVLMATGFVNEIW